MSTGASAAAAGAPPPPPAVPTRIRKPATASSGGLAAAALKPRPEAAAPLAAKEAAVTTPPPRPVTFSAHERVVPWAERSFEGFDNPGSPGEEEAARAHAAVQQLDTDDEDSALAHHHAHFAPAPRTCLPCMLRTCVPSSVTLVSTRLVG